MKSVILVLSLCIMQYSCEGFHYFPVISDVIGNVAGVISDVAPHGKDFLQDKLSWLVGGAKVVGMGIGKYIIRPPLLGVESLISAKDAMAQMGIDLVASVAKGAGNGLKNGWNAVQTIQLPGWQYIMIFPNAVVSIVDKTANTAWFLTTTTGRKVVATEAFMIYATLKIVSGALGPSMRLLHLDCMKMHSMKQKIDQFVVDELEISQCNVCGISNMEAVNNVTITSEGKSFLIVDVPYIIKNINVHIDSANVTDYSGYILENTPMIVTIKQTRVRGQVYFTRGTILKFITLKLRIVHFEGFEIKINVEDKERTYMMDVIEGISDTLAGTVKQTVNRKFQKIEKRLSELIVGKASA